MRDNFATPLAASFRSIEQTHKRSPVPSHGFYSTRPDTLSLSSRVCESRTSGPMKAGLLLRPWRDRANDGMSGDDDPDRGKPRLHKD